MQQTTDDSHRLSSSNIPMLLFAQTRSLGFGAAKSYRARMHAGVASRSHCARLFGSLGGCLGPAGGSGGPFLLSLRCRLSVVVCLHVREPIRHYDTLRSMLEIQRSQHSPSRFGLFL